MPNSPVEAWQDRVPPATGNASELPQLPVGKTKPRTHRENRRRSQGGSMEETIVRQNRALELKMAGATHAEIMVALGFRSISGVHSALERALERDTSRVGSARDEFRKISVARTERLLRALWPQAIGNERVNEHGLRVGKPPDVAVIDRVIKIMERQARLLGLDAPTQITITDETRSELTRMVGDLEKILIVGEAVAVEAAGELSDGRDGTRGGAGQGPLHPGPDQSRGDGRAGGVGPDLRDWGVVAEDPAGDLDPLSVAGAAGGDPDDGHLADAGRPGDRQD